MASSDLFGFFTNNRGVPRKKERSTVRRDALDDGVLQDMSAKAELFAKERKDRPAIEIDGKMEEITHWDDLVGDAFRSLHTNSDPGVLPAEDVLPSHEPNRRVMQRFLSTEEFQQMKPDTTHDEIAAAFGAMRASPKLRELMTGDLAGMAEDARAADKAENRIERAETKLEDLREQAQQMHQDQGEVSDDVKKAIADQVNRKTNARHDLAKIQQNMANTPVTTGAAGVIQQAAKDAKHGVDVVRSLPGMGKGETQKLNADEALRLASMFAENPELFEIAKMLGRIIRDMRFKRARRMEGGTEEVVDMMLGKDLPHVLPSELMHMRHPLLKRWFLRRYIQSALIQRERRGTTEAGRGPLIAVVDESYSMIGMRNIWAKALSMAIIAIARKEKRDAAVVSFASGGEVASWEFPWREQMDAKKVVDMAGHFFAGGTEINDGVTQAKEIIARDERFARADIVLITDGEDWEGWSEKTQKLYEELNNLTVRTHGIQVGGPPSEYLENACQHVASAMDLTGANAATDMLAENIN